LPLLSSGFAAVQNYREADELPSAGEHPVGNGVSIEAGACKLGSARDVALGCCNHRALVGRLLRHD
jgi:hypothetical protein